MPRTSTYKNPVQKLCTFEASELRAATARAEAEGRDVNSYIRALVRRDAETQDRRVIRNRNNKGE